MKIINISLIPLVSLFLFVSCSSTSKKVKNLSAIDKEFSWIENNDFIPIKQIPFVPQEDVFTGDESEYDSLSKESIERLPTPKLENITEADGPLSAAIAHCHNRNFAKGFSIIDKVYAKYKRHPSFWNIQGSCYFLKRERRKALIYYNKSLNIDSSYTPAINNIGVMYWRDGKYQKSLLAFEKALSKNSNSITPIFNLANLSLKFGLVSKSKKYFSQCYRKNSHDRDVVNALGVISLLEGRYADAIRFYESLDDDYLSLPHVGPNFSVALKIKGRVKDSHAIFRDTKYKEYPQYQAYVKRVKKFIGL